jgi:hypothetical protein
MSKVDSGDGMRGRDSLLAHALSGMAGLTLWAVTAFLTGKREPWDADIYWTVSYPLAVIGSAVLGFLFPERPWRWAAMLMLMQFVVMIAMGSGLGLWPLSLIVLAVLTAPAAVASVLAARLRRSALFGAQAPNDLEP